MTLVRYNPVSLLNRWPSIWDDEDFGSLTSASNNLDVYETEDEVIVKANVAGVDSDNVDMTYEKGVLWIKAEKSAEDTSEEQGTKHYAKSSWSYSYKVAVPGMLDHTKEPEAEVENGVVTITFKKAEASKPKKLLIKKKK